MAKPRIFVSYSHQDSAFAQRLVSDLEKTGSRIWYDVSEIDPATSSSASTMPCANASGSCSC